MAIQGIDVSYAQGNIDWAKVKASGVAFAMIRACYGWDDDSQIDRYFRANVQGCEAVGMPYGLYHYSYAQTPEDAEKEAKFFLRVIDGCRPEYPVVFDLEDSSQQKLGKSTLTDMAKAFLSTVEKAGYYAMLYANKYWLTGLLDMSRLSNYDVWLAQWSSAPTYSGNYGMWQYSASGSVPGISGAVDLDYAYQDYPSIIQNAGLNGWGKNPATGSDYQAMYEAQKALYEAQLKEIEELKDGIRDIISRAQNMVK